MTKISEESIRRILENDETVPRDFIDRVLSILAGNPQRREDFVSIIKINEVARILGVSRSGVLDYIKRGLLTRVVGIHGQVMGIRSDSLAAFQYRGVVPRARTH